MLLSSKVLQVPKSSSIVSLQCRLWSTQAVATDWENAKPYASIPGPKNGYEFVRLMGPGGKYSNLPLNKLVESFRKDYGTIAQFPGVLGQKPMVMTFLPEDIEKVFRTEGRYPHRRALDSIEYFRKTHRPDMYPAGAGLTASQGEEWYDFRSKVQQVLMQPRATKLYIPGIDEVACDFIDKIRKILDNNNETPENFFEIMNEWALESIGVIALDTRLGIMENPEASKLNTFIKDIFQATFDYDIRPSVWRYFKTPGFKKAMKLYENTGVEIQKYVMAAVEKYEKNPTPDEHAMGVLEKLIKIDKNIGIAMAEDMLLAGVDTTSSAMVAVLYCLAKNPEKQEILRQEVLTYLPENDSKLTATSFNNIPYLRAVVKEALRMHPVVNGNLRGAGVDMVLQGYQIPKGTDVLLNNSNLSLDEAQFKQSDQFIAERFLKSNDDPKCPHAKDAHPFTYLPFGFGSRMCIGRRFAELEIEVLTARLIREFKVEWNHPDLKFKSITLNLPDGPLKFKLVKL